MPKPRFKIRPHDIGTWLCSSETEKEADYIIDVIELTCSCPDFKEPLGCKHLDAVLAFVTQAEQHNPAPLRKLL